MKCHSISTKQFLRDWWALFHSHIPLRIAINPCLSEFAPDRIMNVPVNPNSDLRIRFNQRLIVWGSRFGQSERCPYTGAITLRMVRSTTVSIVTALASAAPLFARKEQTFLEEKALPFSPWIASKARLKLFYSPSILKWILRQPVVPNTWIFSI